MQKMAGLEIGLPGGIDDVDAAWMTAALRTSGAIAPSSNVSSLSSTPLHAGGLLGQLFRTTITSDDPAAPTSVIVKFPTDVPAQRAMADAFDIYHREVTFYRTIAPRSDIVTPAVHAAMVAEDHSNACIVMEDLAHLRQPDRVAGVTWDEAIIGIRALARFHAGWRGSPELPGLTNTFISIGAPIQRGGLPGLAERGWPGAKRHAARVLTDAVIDFGDRWVERLDLMLDHMCTDPTLCHQDWRADNMFFGDGGQITVIDPQIAGVANGAYDIGYFISQSMERDVRGGRERELIDHYVDEMARRNHHLDAERLLFDTRVAVGLCLMYGFASYAQYELLDEPGKVMTEKILRRAAESIDDLDAAGAVDQLPVQS